MKLMLIILEFLQIVDMLSAPAWRLVSIRTMLLSFMIYDHVGIEKKTCNTDAYITNEIF